MPKQNQNIVSIKLNQYCSIFVFFQGGIYPDGKISKPLTAGDKERLNDAFEVCRRILIEAGAKKIDSRQ